MAKQKTQADTETEVKAETTTRKAKWYRVKEESFIGEALRREGEYVQYAGTPGSNLEEVTEQEVRDAGQVVPEDEKAQLDNREADLNEREAEISDREVKVQLREEELKTLEDSINEKAEELNKREAAVKAKEDQQAKDLLTK